MLNVVICILSAGLLILSFPKPNLEFLAWLALVPWFFTLQKQRPLSSFFLSYLTGVVFFSGVLHWVNYVSTLGFSVLVLYLGLYFAVFGLLFSLRARLDLKSNLFFIPCLWVALEYIRSHLFSGFGWALLGYTQYKNLPIIQISDITGAYGVSFLIVLVNAGIWQMLEYSLKFRAQRKILFSVLCTLFSVFLFLGYGHFRLSQQDIGPSIKVAVVQGNIPQQMKWDPEYRDFILQRYIILTEQAAQNGPDIIIWPETSVPGYLEEDPDLFEEIAVLSKRIAPGYLLVGTPQETQGAQTYNSASLFSAGEVIQRYDKLHLVPFGEFIPWPEFFLRFPFAGLIGDFIPGADFTVFSLSQPAVRFSALICFEDVFADLARGFAQRGAQFLVNMTNDAWFEDSAEPRQHLQASVFRAVENRLSLVRSANTGISCFINPRGRILSRVCDNLGRDVLIEGEDVQSLPLGAAPSFYTRFGDLFAWLCVILGSFSLIKRKR